jgi:hypothetical protein
MSPLCSGSASRSPFLNLWICKRPRDLIDYFQCFFFCFISDFRGAEAAMAKLRKDPIREHRIHNEAIVDANGPEEQAMG